LRVAEHHVDLAKTLDPTGRVKLVDRELRAELALLARIGQRAGHRLQDAEFDAGSLGAKDRRRCKCPDANSGAQRRRLQKIPTAQSWFAIT
jgi:hypothetical protein